MLADYEKGTVYMAAAAIPRGQRITEENFAEYFSKGELDVKLNLLNLPPPVYIS